MEVTCQSYEVLVEYKRATKVGGVEQYGTQSGPKKNNAGASGSQERGMPTGYRLGSEIERMTELQKVLEERILDSRVELSLREVLGIAKKEFHDSIVDLVKRKRLVTEPELEKPLEVRAVHLEDAVVEDELAESHYLKPY